VAGSGPAAVAAAAGSAAVAAVAAAVASAASCNAADAAPGRRNARKDREKDEDGKAVRDFEGNFVRSAAGKVDEVVPASKPKSFSSAEQLQYKLKTKLSKFRRFILDPENISGVTYKGGVMEFQK
jgi:hypothetical protein